MGDVVPYKPKALVDFEKEALAMVSVTSRFMADLPAAIRVAKIVKDYAFIDRVTALIVPLSAIENTIGLVEDASPAIIENIEQLTPIILHVENANGEHDVTCHAEVRQNVVYINAFEIRPRPWLDRLTQSPKRLLIDYKR